MSVGAIPGVIVERVATGQAAQRAGLLAGDVLLRWRRAPSLPLYREAEEGDIGSPFDLHYLWFEQESRGAITLFGLRDSEALSVELPPGGWGLVTRARLRADFEQRYSTAVENLEAEVDGDGLELLAGLADDAAEDSTPTLAAWLRYRQASALIAARRRDQVDDVLAAARRLALAPPARSAAPFAAAWLLYQQAVNVYQLGELDLAEQYWRQARDEFRAGGWELAEASALYSLAQVASRRGDLEAAEELHRQALAQREALAPDSLRLAQSWSNLAKVISRRGQVEEAEDLFRRALESREALAPESLEVAYSANDLGTLLAILGDQAGAQSYFERALELWQRLEPGSPRHATTLNNLGALAFQRGDFAAAERFQLEDLRLREETGTAPLDLATTYANLGRAAVERGQLERAEDYQRQGLEIRERLAPQSLDHAFSLAGLAVISARRGELEAAEALLQQALEIRLAADPESLLVAQTRSNLGQLALEQGDVARALEQLQDALQLARRRERGLFSTGRILVVYGTALLEGGDFEEAESVLEEAVASLELIAPQSVWLANALHAQARLARAAGDAGRARQLFEAALAALEGQQGRLGGPDEARALFRARFDDLYEDYLELLIELEEDQQAFHLLERSRARGLSLLLAERDLELDADLPAELDRERRTLSARYDRVQQRLWSLSLERDHAEIERLRDERTELRRRQEQVEAQVRQHAPRLASWQYPQPLDLPAARRELDPRTLLLAYRVSDEHTWLFAVGPGAGYRIERLQVGRAELSERIDLLRILLAAGHNPAAKEVGLAAESGELWRLLLGPISHQLRRAERLVVLPDGPLYLLPFSILGVPLPHPEEVEGAGDAEQAEEARRPRYLIEALPIAYADSLTVLTQLRQAAVDRSSATRTSAILAAFGDPQLDEIAFAGTNGGARSLHALARLPPLPSARAEVEAIAELFGRQSLTFLGAEASEERAKVVRAELLHFATHTVLDAAVPLDSGLALSTASAAENGLLQAWEIVEQMRLDADLVVLSACETAVGPQVAGEGLLGLARAFQFAGARSVLASLWRVDDRSTSLLMTRFYHHLRSGLAKDQALRQAQLELLRSQLPERPAPRSRLGRWLRGRAGGRSAVDADYSHPYHWAAFQLLGDHR